MPSAPCWFLLLSLSDLQPTLGLMLIVHIFMEQEDKANMHILQSPGSQSDNEHHFPPIFLDTLTLIHILERSRDEAWQNPGGDSSEG